MPHNHDSFRVGIGLDIGIVIPDPDWVSNYAVLLTTLYLVIHSHLACRIRARITCFPCRK
jgi:hypothetical protein